MDAWHNTEQTHDVRLIERCQDGDTEAFGLLVRQYQSYAFALAFRLLCDEQEARDVTQESFIKAWTNIAQFNAERKFTTWLYTIVSHQALDHLRSRKRRFALFPRSPAEPDVPDLPDERQLDETVSNSELAAIIRRLTERLSPTQRLVFSLRDLQDLPIAEVVEITGLSEGSIKTNLHYARKQIRTMLERSYHVKEK